MAGDAQATQRTWRSWLWVALVALAGVGAALAYSWSHPTVKWSQVAEAMGRQDTLHGLGRVYLPDGSEWEYALWARIEGPGKTISNGMVRPAGLSLEAGLSGFRLPPDPMLIGMGQAMDVCGEKGIITRLIASGHTRARARRTEWGVTQALWVEMETPPKLQEAAGGPDAWSFYLDPKSKLVLAVSMFVREQEQEVLRARCEYEYNVPLPQGFTEE